MKILQLIFLPIVIVVTLYGTFSQYITEFWRGFMLGVLVVLLPMLVINIYFARRGREKLERTEHGNSEKNREKGRVTAVLGRDELLSTLREFVARWEQCERLDQGQRWTMGVQGDIQRFGNEASNRLLSLESKYADSWDEGLKHQVQVVSSDLRKLGLTQVSPLGMGTLLTDMERQGKESAEKAKALISLLAK